MIIQPKPVIIDYSSSYDLLSSSYRKIYSEASNQLSALNPQFLPYAQHILNFIIDWCKNDSSYGYEVVSTKRSWYSQKKVTTIVDDEKNGLSWYLYGNAISINVYKIVKNVLFEGGGVEDVLHQSLNFSDGSAREFILGAHKWFSENPVTINGTDRILKIFGIYPSLEKCINVPLSELFSKYINDEDVIYWGGLFSGNSNFTHWEWHPGYQPNQIWVVRENFLNNAFNNINFDELYAEEAQQTTFNKRYLQTYKEIIEEDFISLIKLKTKINLSKEYSILDMLTWAQLNSASLNQMITYYMIQGDYNNKTLFEIIKATCQSASVQYDVEGNLILYAGGLLNVVNTDEGDYYFEYYNEFFEKISLPSDVTYILPVDRKLIDIDFNLTDLNVDDELKPIYSDTMSDVSMSQVINNISDTANQNQNVLFDINEHGMLGDISIRPEKILSLDELQKLAKKQYVFEERITPPNQIKTSNTNNPKIIDLNRLLVSKNVKIQNTVDEMINPNDLL